MKPSSRNMRIAVILVVLFWLASVPSSAQTTGSIVGVVSDQSGAAIAAVRITVRNPQTGLVRAAELTSALGEYVVALLPPGIYDFEVEATGFERYIRKGVTLLVNQTLRLHIPMVVGAVTEKVEVSGEVVGVNAVTPTISEVITREKVNALPLNGRNFLQLTTLVPGAVPGIQMTENFTPTTAGSSSLNVPQVNGLRSQSNNILLDGVDNNELFLGQAAAVPSPDSIQEFSIQTNLYGAEFGRGAGSIVNVVTKSGTDSFHGSLYEFLRNDALDARNFFATQGSKPKLRRNQFGGSIGGPILKEHTHFFGSYEGLRLSEGLTRTASVPSVLEKGGDFSQSAVKPIDPSTGTRFPSDKIPSNRFDPVAAKLLQFYPDPNVGPNLLTSSPVSPTNQEQFLIRVDHRLGKKDSFFGRYYFQDGNATLPFATTFLGSVDVPTFPIANDWRFQHAVLSHVHVFSPAMVNEFRFGFNRNVLVGLAPAIPRKATDFGFTFPATIPIDVPQWSVAGFTVNGYTDMGPGNKATNVFQWLDILSYTRGRHTFKAGADIRRHQLNGNIASAFNGAYIFTGAVTANAFADFLLGRTLLFIQGGGNAALAFRSSSFNFFGEDQISLSRKLKLTLGLRYELPTWPVEIHDHISAFRPGQQSKVQPQAPPGLVYPGDPGIPRATVDSPKKNFAPRVGVAWDPTGSGKTSVRAGYGIFYDVIPWHNFYQLQIAPPFSFFSVYFLPSGGLADPTGGTGAFLPGLTEIPFSQIPRPFQFNVLSKDLTTPYAQQYNLTVQHELFTGWLLQVGYVGTTGVHLPNTFDVNEARFVPGNSDFSNINARRPFVPNFASVFAQSTVFNSKYDSFQLSVNKRPTHGWSFLASYTFSKTIDTLSTPQVFRGAKGQQGTIMTSTNSGLDRGLAAFDARHRFVFSYVWDIPQFRGDNAVLRKLLSGWGINGIIAFQTGLPFTITDGTDPTVDGTCCNNDRPDLVGDPHLQNRTLKKWFNTAAFKQLTAPSNHYGSAGRNILTGPGLNNWDFSIVKKTYFAETANIEFRTEFFNLWNHPGFAFPISDITSPSFGRIVDTRPGNERQIQLVLKLNF